MNILSLFDGMACGMLAMLKAGTQVDNYYAYEIDKYAVQTAKHNFPNIQELGDVFNADFRQYTGIDYLIGGSPCTYWSIAQSPDKRETTASGIGWELFSQYVRALNEAKPKFFIYENNKSMATAIRQSITETFGFEPIMINSALLSAQNRQRLYWVGKRNADGTYSKVDVQQPEDRGILLRDILDGAGLTNCDKAYCLTSSYDGACAWNTIERHQRSMVAEPVGTTKDGKAYCLSAGYSNGSGEKIGNYAAHTLKKGCKSMVAEPVNVTADGKAQCLRATCYKDGVRNIAGNDIDKKTGVAEPVACRCRGRKDENGNGYAKYECREDNKSNTLDTNSVNGSMVAEPVCMRYERSNTAKKLRKDYESGKIKHGYHEYSELHPRTDGKSNTLSTVLKDNPICVPVRCFTLPREDGVQTESKQYRVYETSGKSTTLCAEGGGMGAKTGLYAIPVEFNGEIPVKAISAADGKTYTVYEVKGGNITIKGKTYPIKLVDGYYIIRKLTVSECKRLQTVPEWYEFSYCVNQTQFFGEEVEICKNAKLRDAISLLQAEKLNYVTNIISGSCDTELRSLLESMLTTLRSVKKKGVNENAKLYKVTASSTIKSGNENSPLIQQENALFVTNRLDMQDATECVLSITINGSDMGTLCIPKKDNVSLMEILGVNTTKQLTENGFIELLQKKCSEENSQKMKLFIISTLISWIMIRTIYMFATTKPIYVCIGSWNEWRQHLLTMDLLYLKMGNIGGVSNSAAYKMLGNGWTVDVIAHLINATENT